LTSRNFVIVLSISLLSLLIYPLLVTDRYILHVSIIVMLSAYLACSWNILGGYVGQYSLGHAAFFGVGAYTSTLLFMHWGLSPWIGLLTGACIATFLGLFVGFLCFRYGVKGPYFLLLSLAFSEIFYIVAVNVEFTRGEIGITIPFRGGSFASFQYAQKWPYFYTISAMLVVAVLLTFFISRSKLGYFFVAVRESESAAQAMGVNVMTYKLIAAGVSAFMTSIGGTFYAQYIMYINPSSIIGLHVSIDMLVYSIVGGLGTVFGPALGAFLLVPIAVAMRGWLGGSFIGVHLIIYGAILIVVIIFIPEGLMGIRQALKLGSGSIFRRGAKRFGHALNLKKKFSDRIS